MEKIFLWYKRAFCPHKCFAIVLKLKMSKSTLLSEFMRVNIFGISRIGHLVVTLNNCLFRALKGHRVLNIDVLYLITDIVEGDYS